MTLNAFNTAIILLAALGAVLLCFGILFSKYPREGRSLNIKRLLGVGAFSESKPLKPFLDFLVRNRQGRLYRFSSKVITQSETNLSVQSLYLLKIIAVAAVTILILLIRYTNIDIIKLSIISKPTDSFALFQDTNINDYSRNVALYNAVIKRIGEDTLKKLDGKGRLAEVEKALPAFLQTNNVQIIEEKAGSLVKTYQAVKSVKLIDLTVILIILTSFWLPELILLVKKLLLGNMYRKEVIKLENIFELLGSIRGFKTISIIEEMAKASKVYWKHLNNCMELFKTEKELALESLKLSVKNSRFSKLVDVMRVYAMTDKSLAVQILERNKLEKEEELFLTAEEDIDLVDLVAFISIVPILLGLVNLFLKPMLDMIYEAFKFI